MVESRVVSGIMRIVGGEVAKVGAWPWTALLGRTGLSGGEIMVTEHLVLTHIIQFTE